jgi:hypothetical protein
LVHVSILLIRHLLCIGAVTAPTRFVAVRHWATLMPSLKSFKLLTRLEKQLQIDNEMV